MQSDEMTRNCQLHKLMHVLELFIGNVGLGSTVMSFDAPISALKNVNTFRF